MKKKMMIYYKTKINICRYLNILLYYEIEKRKNYLLPAIYATIHYKNYNIINLTNFITISEIYI